MRKTTKKKMLLAATVAMLVVNAAGCAGCAGCNGSEVVNPTVAPTVTEALIATPTVEPTMTEIPVVTPTVELTVTVAPTVEPTVEVEPTEVLLLTPTKAELPTEAPVATVAPTATPTEAPTPTSTPTPSPTVTPTSTPTPTPEPTATSTPTPTPTNTPTPKPTNTPTPSPSPTPTPVKGIEAGDYVTFGSYQQTELTGDALTEDIVNAEWELYRVDNKYRNVYQAEVNGETYYKTKYERDTSSIQALIIQYFAITPIEWLVLEVEDGKAFLLSKNVLDKYYYNVEEKDDEGWPACKDAIWEISDLRAWLNGEFYNMAFTPAEQESIVLTTVKNPDSEFGVDGGKDTLDKVYALSGEEVYKYFGKIVDEWQDECPDKTEHIAAPTAYASAMGIGDPDGSRWYDKYGDWWLRTPGQGTDWASYICGMGIFMNTGCYAYGNLGIRPVVWIDVTTADVEKVN